MGKGDGALSATTPAGARDHCLLGPVRLHFDESPKAIIVGEPLVLQSEEYSLLQIRMERFNFF